jgi:sugar O-acyltransferase (sialic acid O-acetyltransferase NeuD family)
MRYFLVGLDKDLKFLIESNNGEIIGYSGPQKESVSLDYFGPDQDAIARLPGDVVCLICIDNPTIKRKLAVLYRDWAGWYRSPHSRISPNATIGNGFIAQDGVYVSEGCVIGDFVKLNVGAQVHHDCRIGDYATVAPRVTLLGNARVGSLSYIGSAAVVRNKCAVGEGCTVGMGSVVVSSIPDGSAAYGNPARVQPSLVVRGGS